MFADVRLVGFHPPVFEFQKDFLFDIAVLAMP
jgi:hypothetical protein